MKPDGMGWLYVPTGLVDGPLPDALRAGESPVKNPLYKQQSSPVLKYWKRDDNALAPPSATPSSRTSITTYRLTEHYLAGAMSRWNPWLTELQPELFVELIARAGRREGHRQPRLGAQSARPRGADPGQGAGHAADAAVHHRRQDRPPGRHAVALGLRGPRAPATSCNELTALVGDPNVSIHEGKAFVCNVEKA